MYTGLIVRKKRISKNLAFEKKKNTDYSIQ